MKERKIFSRDYVPVYVASLIFILLVVGVLVLINIKYEEENDIYNHLTNKEEIVVNNSNSKCNKDELDKLVKKANDVAVSYEFVSREVEVPADGNEWEGGIVTQKILEITTENITDDIYIKVSNDFNSEVLTMNSKSAKKGKQTFDSVNLNGEVVYTFKIYANKYNCKDEEIRIFNLTTKSFNTFSLTSACGSYPEFKYCADFLDEDVSYETFYKEFDKYKEKHPETTKAKSTTKNVATTKKKNESNKKNEEEKVDNTLMILIYVLSGLIVIVFIVGVVLVINIKKNGGIDNEN